jgi:hypothetical protein
MEFLARDYRQWLETKKPKEIVGVSRAACDCPVARWLRETRRRKVIVETNIITLCRAAEKPNRSYFAPEWVVDYLSAIDAGDQREITAETALALLTFITTDLELEDTI